MPPKRKAAASTATDKKGTAKKQKTPTLELGSDEDGKPVAKKQKSDSGTASAATSSGGKPAAAGSGKQWNWKFASWNVNGIRAWAEKNAQSYISSEDPDVICLQETKCNSTSNLPSSVKDLPGYKKYWLSGEIEGYSGTALFSKTEPIKVTYGINVAKHDKEGRVITAEYDKFYMVTAYIPNSGRGLPRLAYRTKEWDVEFRSYLQKLDAVKPVILCGDLNVAHLDIDLANPKTNTKTAGFTKEERDQFTVLLKSGFVDSFRHLYPDVTGAYSYWSYMGNARSKNTGWRLDYYVISERLKSSLCDSMIRSDVQGSDHCPIVLTMNL